MNNYYVIKGRAKGTIERFIDGQLVYSADYSCNYSDDGGEHRVTFKRIQTYRNASFSVKEAREEVRNHAEYWRTS